MELYTQQESHYLTEAFALHQGTKEILYVLISNNWSAISSEVLIGCYAFFFLLGYSKIGRI